MTSERLAGYVAGLQVGYAARCREESDEWQEETSHRVFLSGQFYNRPTAAERLAERLATLRQGHAAGLHDVPRPACPLCMPGPQRCPQCNAGPFALPRNLAGHVSEAHRDAVEFASICTVCGRPARECRPYRGRSCRPTTP